MSSASFLGGMVKFLWATRLYSLLAAEATLHLWLKPSCGTVYSLTHQDSPSEPTHRTDWKGMIAQNQKLYDVDFLCFFKKKNCHLWLCYQAILKLKIMTQMQDVVCFQQQTLYHFLFFCPPPSFYPFLSCPEVIFVCVVAELYSVMTT